MAARWWRLLGDQTIRHDLSGLAQLAETNLPVVVVAVDNGGGQIFRDLPFASDVPLDDFVSPRATDLGAVASAFGVPNDRGRRPRLICPRLCGLGCRRDTGFLAREVGSRSGTTPGRSQSMGQFGMPSVVAVTGFLGHPSDFDGVIGIMFQRLVLAGTSPHLIWGAVPSLKWLPS